MADVSINALPINLIVEIGNGSATSNSYASLEFADNYFRNRGDASWFENDEETKKKYLVLATDFIDASFKWKGKKKNVQQGLAFPRLDLIDNDGYTVTDIPLALQKAVCEGAKLVKAKTTLFSSKDENGDVKRKKVDTLEVEYFGKSSKTDDETYETIYSVLNTLLQGLYKTESDKATYNVGAVWLDGLY